MKHALLNWVILIILILNIYAKGSVRSLIWYPAKHKLKLFFIFFFFNLRKSYSVFRQKAHYNYDSSSSVRSIGHIDVHSIYLFITISFICKLFIFWFTTRKFCEGVKQSQTTTNILINIIISSGLLIINQQGIEK